MFKLAVFVSGRGSNLKAIVSQIKSGNLTAEVAAVVSNKENCGAIEFAKKENISAYVVSENKEGTKKTYKELLELFKQQNINLIVLAGFLKKIPNDFVKAFQDKIINIHPALLPSFGGKGMYGINVHRAVFNSSAKVSGATVHFVDEIYDNGKIIDQICVDISNVESPEEIAEKVLKAEHELLPRVISNFVHNKIKLKNNRVYLS